jgi:two-component system, NtrC family, sensor kinase
VIPNRSPKRVGHIFRDAYYRELFTRHFIRLSLTYLAPLVLLAIYFQWQYSKSYQETSLLHLQSIAESQAGTFDLFLRERLVNVENLIDDPRLQLPPSSAVMKSYLEKLTKNSDSFVDVGFFNAQGIQIAYAGPLPSLEYKDYSNEAWFIALKSDPNRFVITDSYLGMRKKPHFTIAVNRIISAQYVVLRATLDPERIHTYISSLEGSQEFSIAIINHRGDYQIVTPKVTELSHSARIVPPQTQRIGTGRLDLPEVTLTYAYAWLTQANWALIGMRTRQVTFSGIDEYQIKSLLISFMVILIMVAIIIVRSNKVVELQLEQRTTKAQFEHAAKLASVGELSAGVAHEINNPLAIISEEAGLIRDLLDPELCPSTTFADLPVHLDNIQEAVFRCRDITRKLLSFVRKTDIKVMQHDINTLIDEIVDAFWIREMAVSNIEIIKIYRADIPPIMTDGNQMKQVFLNLLTNSYDAIVPPGKITITTSADQNHITVSIADTGNGITQEHIEKIFLPFFTTKEVGKGTGLGLSVSLSIIKSLGGTIHVESIPGQGSVFSVVLPIH